MEWKPISEAPKDGRKVLGYWGGQPSVINYEDGNWWCCRADYAVVPTHWMPLPAPPLSEKE